MSEYYAVNGSCALSHHGILGQKWGVRRYQKENGTMTSAGKSRYLDANGNVKRVAGGSSKGYSVKKATNNKTEVKKQSNKNTNNSQDEARKEQRNKNLKTAAKVGAVVAGTALAAYGTYKLSKYVQDKRSAAAIAKAQDYVSKNFLEKVGTSNFKNGAIQTHYKNGLGTEMTIASRGSKVIGDHNSKVVSTANKMYRDATSTKLDKGLSKIVKAGDAVGNKTRKAGYAVSTTAKKASDSVKRNATSTANKVLDVVKPKYEYTPGNTSEITRNMGNGITYTKTATELVKRKVKRG